MRHQWATSLLIALAGCDGSIATVGQSAEELTSVGGTARAISWDSFVYVAPDADAAAVRSAIARQVKSSLGALRERSIGIADRAALHNLDPATWTRERLSVEDPASGAVTGAVDRVRYHYADTALVGKTTSYGASVALTLLAGDYTKPGAAAALQPACVDEQTDPDSLWYHFQPARLACQKLVSAENAAIAGEQEKLAGGAAATIPPSDARRRFVPLRATLGPIDVAPKTYPELDRLWGAGTDRQKVIAYAFVGVEHDERDSHDVSSAEYQRLLRTLRQKLPGLQAVETSPFALLLDYWVDGQRLDAVTWDDVATWMIDDRGYPGQLGTDASKIEALRQQVIDRFAERWIVWRKPVTIRVGAEMRAMTVEVRTFWGKEDGDPDSRVRAAWRYGEAFWYGDIFAYAGHSHFGHGPLEPTNFTSGNLPDRYQVMLVNSCLSYNYYDLDFIEMHPGKSRQLDVVMNGLPAYWNGMGESTGLLLAALLDGAPRSWADVLEGMKVSDPQGRPGYEPMRGVNGELDNVYDPSVTPLAITPTP